MRGSLRFGAGGGVSSINLKPNYYVCNYSVLKYSMLILKEAHVCLCNFFSIYILND